MCPLHALGNFCKGFSLGKQEPILEGEGDGIFFNVAIKYLGVKFALLHKKNMYKGIFCCNKPSCP
jgi:hypothetical protein